MDVSRLVTNAALNTNIRKVVKQNHDHAKCVIATKFN